jgi:hypothetical protein
MSREEWFDWAMDVAAATSYGVHEVLDCVELLEGRAEEEVIKNILPALLGAMGGSGAKAQPSDLIRGVFFASDLVETIGGVFRAFLTGVPAGTRLTGSDCANRGKVDSPDYAIFRGTRGLRQWMDSQVVGEAQRGLDASKSVLPENSLFPEQQQEVVINPSTCKGPSIQLEKMCPLFRRCESEFKSHLCDDPPNGSVIRSPLCAVCGRPLIVSPEEPDARGSYSPMAACNYCKRQGRLEDLKRED